MDKPLPISGWTHISSGKVRDLYVDDSDDARILVVSSDRISAFDYILNPTIPDKGRVLTALSLWWFERLADSDLNISHHVISTDVPEQVAGRAMICERLRMVPVECVARGYLAGSGWQEYQDSQTVCDVQLPAGLDNGSRLPEAIFTPARKAEVGDHDENVSFEVVEAEQGTTLATDLKQKTLEIYAWAEKIATDRGIILADTKFEFGMRAGSTELVLGDEVLTSDSSRYWPADEWSPGRSQPSFDKQFVRDWLTSPASGWNTNSEDVPPALPQDVIEKTRQRYVDAYEKLTGRTFS